MATFKQKCSRCKKNWVIVSRSVRYQQCYECEKDKLVGEVKDPELKKLLDIPDEYYRDNAFLRSIKINAIRFGNLTEKQIAAFKKAVEKHGKPVDVPEAKYV